MYGASKKIKDQEESRVHLKVLYDKIPDTYGCMEHISKPESEGGCGAWCCRLQNPQVLYAEFLNSWKYISENFSDKEFINLIGRCLRKYLFPTESNGCVLFNEDEKLCSQHDTRPFNCRIYGITPAEEFTPRYERLKVIYPDTKEQCNLVKTKDGRAVTKEDIDNWWIEVRSVDIRLGIKPEFINDGQLGCYRTYHDHILLHILGEAGLSMLTSLRLNSSSEDKEHVIASVLKSIVKMIGSFKGNANGQEKRDATSSPSENS
jgi:Fe-S-cluster containining protein